MKYLSIFISALLFGGVLSGCNENSKVENEETGKPNILFILTDDHLATAVHASGNTAIQTPNMDRLAQQGISYNSAYIMGSMSGAVCAPSRDMLMTGRPLFQIDPTVHSIDPEHITLPQALQKQGYHTYHVGKWHNGKASFARSFNSAGKILFQGMSDQYDIPLYDFDSTGVYPDSAKFISKEIHCAELYAEEAASFLKSYESSDPFFMFVAFQTPHDPRQAPQEFLDKYDTAKIELPPNFMKEHPFDNGDLDIRDELLAGFPRTEAEVKANIAAYYAMITHTDAQMGKILEALESTGKAENTIIIFAGDNGLAVGQHGLMGKQNMYQHSMNVPLILAGPGIPEGKISNANVYLNDIYPTLFEMLDFEKPESVDSRSFLPSLTNPEFTGRDTLYFAYRTYQRAVIHDGWKLILYDVRGETNRQLFNLKEDPWEMNDLSGQPEYEERIVQMREMLDIQMKKNGDVADITKEHWGVEDELSWLDQMKRDNPNGLKHLMELVNKEREMRGFGSRDGTKP